MAGGWTRHESLQALRGQGGKAERQQSLVRPLHFSGGHKRWSVLAKRQSASMTLLRPERTGSSPSRSEPMFRIPLLLRTPLEGSDSSQQMPAMRNLSSSSASSATLGFGTRLS